MEPGMVTNLLIVRSRWVGTNQLFQKWYFRNVLPTLMRRSYAPLLFLRSNTSLIMCSKVAMKLRLRASRWGPIVSRHEVMWQSKWNSFMHSEHSCGACRRVWRTLANLVTGGLQPWSSKFLTGVRRTVNLPGLVAVPCAVRELWVVFGVPTQRERGIIEQGRWDSYVASTWVSECAINEKNFFCAGRCMPFSVPGYCPIYKAKR